MLNYEVDDKWRVLVKKDGEHIDTVGAFDSEEGAKIWGDAIVAKYNLPEYAEVEYPNALPEQTQEANPLLGGN